MINNASLSSIPDVIILLKILKVLAERSRSLVLYRSIEGYCGEFQLVLLMVF